MSPAKKQFKKITKQGSKLKAHSSQLKAQGSKLKKQGSRLIPIGLRRKNTGTHFTIIIPVYNEENYITHLLTDLVKQTYQNFEILIVNNNSTDNTVKVIQDFFSQKQFHPEYRDKFQILNCTRQGIAAARNYGAEHAKTDWLIFFDADLRLKNNWLEIAASKVALNKDMVALNGVLIIDTPNKLKWLYYNTYTAISYSALRFLSMTTGKAHIAGNNMVIRKDWFVKNGMFPHLICEDFIFSKNLYKILTNPRKQTKLSFQMIGYWHSRRFDEKGFLRSIAQWWYHAFKYANEEEYDIYR